MEIWKLSLQTLQDTNLQSRFWLELSQQIKFELAQIILN